MEFDLFRIAEPYRAAMRLAVAHDSIDEVDCVCDNLRAEYNYQSNRAHSSSPVAEDLRREAQMLASVQASAGILRAYLDRS
jgi:hypothetical protein